MYFLCKLYIKVENICLLVYVFLLNFYFLVNLVIEIIYIIV